MQKGIISIIRKVKGMLVARNKIEGAKATNFGQNDVLSAACFLYLLTNRNSIGESVEGVLNDGTSFRSV